MQAIGKEKLDFELGTTRVKNIVALTQSLYEWLRQVIYCKQN